MFCASRPHPNSRSPSAPRFASFSSSTGRPSRVCISFAGRSPRQPGRKPSLLVEVEAGGGCVVHRRYGIVVDDEFSGQVADRDAHVVVSEVEADRESGIADEREQLWWSACAALLRWVGRRMLLDDPPLRELL